MLSACEANNGFTEEKNQSKCLSMDCIFCGSFLSAKSTTTHSSNKSLDEVILGHMIPCLSCKPKIPLGTTWRLKDEYYSFKDDSIQNVTADYNHNVFVDRVSKLFTKAAILYEKERKHCRHPSATSTAAADPKPLKTSLAFGLMKNLLEVPGFSENDHQIPAPVQNTLTSPKASVSHHTEDTHVQKILVKQEIETKLSLNIKEELPAEIPSCKFDSKRLKQIKTEDAVLTSTSSRPSAGQPVKSDLVDFSAPKVEDSLSVNVSDLVPPPAPCYSPISPVASTYDGIDSNCDFEMAYSTGVDHSWSIFHQNSAAEGYFHAEKPLLVKEEFPQLNLMESFLTSSKLSRELEVQSYWADSFSTQLLNEESCWVAVKAVNETWPKQPAENSNVEQTEAKMFHNWLLGEMRNSRSQFRKLKFDRKEAEILSLGLRRERKQTEFLAKNCKDAWKGYEEDSGSENHERKGKRKKIKPRKKWIASKTSSGKNRWRQNPKISKLCQICKRQVYGNFDRHVLINHLAKPLYVCLYCNYWNKGAESNIRSHVTRKHPGQPMKFFHKRAIYCKEMAELMSQAFPEIETRKQPSAGHSKRNQTELAGPLPPVYSGKEQAGTTGCPESKLSNVSKTSAKVSSHPAGKRGLKKEKRKGGNFLEQTVEPDRKCAKMEQNEKGTVAGSHRKSGEKPPHLENSEKPRFGGDAGHGVNPSFLCPYCDFRAFAWGEVKVHISVAHPGM